jgi:folate-binding protein YgfZ
MSPTPLQDALCAQSGVTPRPASVIDYRGSETAVHFDDPCQEFAALQNGCGIFDLGFRARLSLKGSDRIRWMNGMVTNNIRDLADGRGVYAFLLNPQGRILGDMHVFHRGDSLIVETDRSQMEAILATFDHYIIMDDVEVTNITDEQTALGLSGPNSRGLLNAVGIEVPELQPLQMMKPCCTCACDCVECTVIRSEDVPHESYEIWLDAKDVLKTWQALVAAGAAPVGSEAIEMQRIFSGVPLYGVDIRERDLPQETEQARALNFNKGCYVGQEIVERIRSRGNVHRKFTGFLAEGIVRIAPGDKIVSAEKEVGEITSVATLPAPSGNRTAALGYIRREVGIPGREVTIGATRVVVAQFPLTGVSLRQGDEAMLHKV